MAKREINQNLTPHRPIKIAKRRKTQNLTLQKSLKLGKRKNTQNLTYEKLSKLTKRENLTTQKNLNFVKCKNTQNLTYEKPLKLTKRENLTPQKQLKTTKQSKIKSKNKERIEVIREQLRELAYKLSKSELKEIKKHLYMVENKKGLLGSKKPRKYLDELDENIRKLDKYYHDDDFEFKGIRNIQDLLKLPIGEDYYKPTLVKNSYNSNYIQYESKGDKILTVKDYLSLIEPYLPNMINDYKSKVEWKIQLTAEINFTSLKPDSDETRIMYTKSD